MEREGTHPKPSQFKLSESFSRLTLGMRRTSRDTDSPTELRTVPFLYVNEAVGRGRREGRVGFEGDEDMNIFEGDKDVNRY
jgi:hypothetical protein